MSFILLTLFQTMYFFVENSLSLGHVVKLFFINIMAHCAAVMRPKIVFKHIQELLKHFQGRHFLSLYLCTFKAFQMHGNPG